MNIHSMLEAYLGELRNSTDAKYRDEFVVRFQTEGYCQVVCNGSLEGVEDEIIKREIEVHRALGRDFEWSLFSTDHPSDLFHRLLAHGFVPDTPEVICALDLNLLPESTTPVRVEKVANPHQLADFRSVAEVVFEKDYTYTAGTLAECMRTGDQSETGFVAYRGDTPVAIGRLTKDPRSEFAGLFTGGTLPQFRGQGYYSALVWARARFARELGAKFVTVDARPTSLPILLRLGFCELVASSPCLYTLR